MEEPASKPPLPVEPEPAPEEPGSKSGEGHAKDTKEKTEGGSTSTSSVASTSSVLPAEAPSAVTAPSPLVVWPESPDQPSEHRSAPSKQAPANPRLAEWLALEPQAARQALAATLLVLTATPEAESRPWGLAGDRSAAMRGGGAANGGDGGSTTEGHSSPPTPGPGPGGSGGGSAAGGGTASGSSAASLLVSLEINVPASVMRRLGIPARSARQTFFVLIPEKPD